MKHDLRAIDTEPTATELAAIEAEWPLIAAELAVLDAEICVLTADRPSDLDWRRLRRAQHGVTREMAVFLAGAPTAVPVDIAA